MVITTTNNDKQRQTTTNNFNKHTKMASVPNMELLKNIDTDTKYTVHVSTYIELMEMFRSKKLRIAPSQRAYAWVKASHRDAFVDTLVTGMPFPEILIYKNKNDDFLYVEDGQCRLRTMFAFMFGVSYKEWNDDGTAPIIPVNASGDAIFPDRITDRHVTYSNIWFNDFPTSLKLKVSTRQVATVHYTSDDPVLRNLIYQRYNQGIALSPIDKIWSAKDLYPVNKAVAFFFDESLQSHKHLPWTLSKLSDTNQDQRNKSGTAVANAVRLFFTAAYGHTIWEGIDKNRDEARIKCLEKNYATFSLPIDTKMEFDDTSVNRILDTFIEHARFLKERFNSQKYEELWDVEKLGGFLLFNIMLDRDDRKKLSLNDLDCLCRFCNRHNNSRKTLSPIKRLVEIFKCKDDEYTYITLRRGKDNFRCKHLFNWEDGLLNAKACVRR